MYLFVVHLASSSCRNQSLDQYYHFIIFIVVECTWVPNVSHNAQESLECLSHSTQFSLFWNHSKSFTIIIESLTIAEISEKSIHTNWSWNCELKRELKFLRTYCLGFYTCWIQAFLYQNFRFKVDLKQTYVLFHFHMWYILKC
jgi:hypothetical protein